MAEVHQSRRTVLKLLLAAIGSIGLWKYLSSTPLPQKPKLEVALKDVPPEGALVFDEQRVAVICSAGEFFALSLICTHLGCTVRITGDELVCPCHGSRFDRTGQVLSGPAPRALTRMPLQIEGETLKVSLS